MRGQRWYAAAAISSLGRAGTFARSVVVEGANRLVCLRLLPSR